MSMADELGLAPAGGEDLSDMAKELGLVSERPRESGVSPMDAELGLVKPQAPVLPPITFTQGPAGAPAVATMGQLPTPVQQGPAPVVAVPETPLPSTETPDPITSRLGATGAALQNTAASAAAIPLGLLAGAADTLQAKRLKEAMSAGAENLEQAFLKGAPSLVPSMGPAPIKEFSGMLQPTGTPASDGLQRDADTAQSLKYIDYPRTVEYANQLEKNGWALNDPSLPASVMHAAVALGDLTLINKLTERSAALGDRLMDDLGTKGEVQLSDDKLGSMTLMALANMGKEVLTPVGTEVGAALLPAEAALLGVAKAVPKLATNVEKAMPSLIKAAGSTQAYEAAAKYGKIAVEKATAQTLGRLKGMGVVQEATAAGAKALQEGLSAASTTLKPLGIKRAADQAAIVAKKTSAGLGSVPEKLNAFAKDVAFVMNGDKIERVPDFMQPHVMKIQNAGSYGRNTAALEVTQVLDKALGQDYTLNDRAAQDGLGYLRSMFLSPKSEVVDAMVNELSVAGEVNEGIRKQVVSAVRDAMQNKTVVNPRLESVYNAAGFSIRHMNEYMPGLAEKIDQYTVAEMKALSESLVNPVAPAGSLTNDLFRESGVSSTQVAEARAKAWARAWQEMDVPVEGQTVSPKEIFKRQVGKELVHPEHAEDVLKAIDAYMTHTRKVTERMKMGQGFNIKEGLYLHHMMNENAINGRFGQNSLIREAVASSKKYREGVILEHEFENNLRTIMEKDLSEVHAASHYNEGWNGLVKDDRALMPVSSIKEGKTRFDAQGRVWIKPKDGKPEYVLKGYKALDLDGLDGYVLHNMFAANPKAVESKLSESLRAVLEASKAGAKQTTFTTGNIGGGLADTLAPEDMQKVLAIMGKRKWVIQEDLQHYIMQMRSSQKASYQEYLRNNTLGESPAAFIDLPAREKLTTFSKEVNSVIRPLATSLDIGGLSQRLAIYGRIHQELGTKGLVGVIKRTNRLMDERDLDMYSRLLKNGGLYQNRMGLKTLGNEVQGSVFQRVVEPNLYALNRHMGYGERVMYGNSFTSPGFDTKTRIATARYMEERMTHLYDTMWSHPSTKKMAGMKASFMDRLLGNADLKGLVRPDGTVDELKFGKSINEILGSYNPAARTEGEKQIMANFFPYYGWWKGTFVAALSAPVRHPLNTVVAPLVAMDSLNYVLSGNNMWDNPDGKKFSIKVDPAKLGFKGEPFYVGAPSTIALPFGAYAGEKWAQVASSAKEGKYELAKTLALHAALIDAPKASWDKLVNRTMVSHYDEMQKVLQYAATHEMDEAGIKGFTSLLGTLNYSAAEVAQAVREHDYQLSPELMYKISIAGAGVLSGNNMGFARDPNAMEKRREQGVSGGMTPNSAAMRNALIQQATERGQAPTMQSVQKGLSRAVLTNAAEKLTNDPVKQKQIVNAASKFMK